MHQLRVPLMVGLAGFNGLRSIFSAIPHSNGALLQFIRYSGKGMRLEVMNHLEFVFDITEEQVGGSQLITFLGRNFLCALRSEVAQTAGTSGTVVPATSASTMARPDTSRMSVATDANFTPASSRILRTR